MGTDGNYIGIFRNTEDNRLEAKAYSLPEDSFLLICHPNPHSSVIFLTYLPFC